jgi:hypothetical protein
MGSFIQRRNAVARLAAAQWGHVTRTQLLALGIAPGTICKWIAAGHLIPVHRGVYAVAYPRVEPIALAMAAVLACGPGAVLSHDSALALWELRRWPATPEVISLEHVRRPRIVAHRSRTLTAADRTVQRGVPVTRAARAIDDIRPRLTHHQHVRLINAARLERLISAEEAAEREERGALARRCGAGCRSLWRRARRRRRRGAAGSSRRRGGSGRGCLLQSGHTRGLSRSRGGRDRARRRARQGRRDTR